MKFNNGDYIKSERVYRIFLKNKLKKQLEELNTLIDLRIENGWKLKDAKELRRKSLEVRKELKKMKSFGIKIDRRKIKYLNKLGKEK